MKNLPIRKTTAQLERECTELHDRTARMLAEAVKREGFPADHFEHRHVGVGYRTAPRGGLFGMSRRV